MKKIVSRLVPLVLIIGLLSATPANSQCILDMSGATARFGFDGTTNTLFISNIQFLGTAFTIRWKLNLTNGNWDIVGAGGTPSGTGGLIDFSRATVNFGACVNMVIRNFVFLQQSFSACWSLNLQNGNWILQGLGDQCPSGTGGRSRVTVRVSNAVLANNPPIAGAGVSLTVRGSSQVESRVDFSCTTNTSGECTMDNVPFGNYQLEVEKQGFTDSRQNVTVNETTESFLVALSPTQAPGQYRIVLTWGSQPQDLDSHLLVPADSAHTNGFHIFYPIANRGQLPAYPFAFLDVDDVTALGPETITIGQCVNGTYQYWVYLYCCEAQALLIRSRANVKLFRGSQQLGSWDVPTSGTGRYWHVFDLTNCAGGTFNVVNTILATGPAPQP